MWVYYFLKFVKSEQFNFVGYEINNTAINKLKKDNIPYVENINNSEKYDNIVSINVLEHIEDDTKILIMVVFKTTWQTDIIFATLYDSLDRIR